MKKITVKIESLVKILDDIRHTQADFVELAIMEGGNDQGEEFPACLHFEAIKKLSNTYIIDLESIDEVTGQDFAS